MFTFESLAQPKTEEIKQVEQAQLQDDDFADFKEDSMSRSMVSNKGFTDLLPQTV